MDLHGQALDAAARMEPHPFNNWTGDLKARANEATAGFYALMPAIADELETLDGDNEYSFESLLETHVFTMDDDGTDYTYNYVGAADSPDTFVHDGSTFLYFGVGADDHTVSYDNITVAGGVAVDLAVGEGQISGEATDYFNGAVKNVIGSDYADTIAGDTQANSLSGGTGEDTIAADGEDTVTGGADDDTFALKFTSAASSTVTDFDLGDDKLDLSALGITLYDLQAAATEASGTTTLVVGGKSYVITGITKTNLFDPANAAFLGLIGGTAGATITGTGSAELLDSVDGATANNDTINGKGMTDTLAGGAGNDTYVWESGNGGDYVNETANLSETNVVRLTGITYDKLYLNSSSAGTTSLWVYLFNTTTSLGGMWLNNQWAGDETTLGQEVRFLLLDDRTIDLTGGLLYRGSYGTNTTADTLYARSDIATNDTLEGGNGNDTIYGYDGDDVLDGGMGTDSLYGGAGNDTYRYTADTVYNTIYEIPSLSESNTIVMDTVSAADIRLNCFTGDLDDLYLLDYSTSPISGFIVDEQWGGDEGTAGTEVTTLILSDATWDLTGALTYRSDPTSNSTSVRDRYDADTNDTLEGGSGNNTIQAYGGNDLITGGNGNDTMYGGNGNDTLYGDAGTDSISGEAGGDTIYGGTGNDTLIGGTGSDTYVWDVAGSGDGQDQLNETALLSEHNVLRLDGVYAADVCLDTSTGGSDDLYVYIYDTALIGSVSVNNQWTGTESTAGYEVDTLELEDATWDLTGGLLYRGTQGPTAGADDIRARSDANTDDTLDGGVGSDTLHGYGGNDTYMFGTGYEHDSVMDTVGSNVLDLLVSYHHYTDSGAGNADRTYYLDATNTDWVFVDDFNLNGWSVI